MSRFHDRDNFLRSRVIILVDIVGYWKHEARSLQAWEKIKIKNSHARKMDTHSCPTFPVRY